VIHVTLSGTPYELGLQHGQALRPLVDAMVRYESRRHAHIAPEALDLEGVRQRVERAAPHLLAELRGIADGSQVPYDLLLEMNLRILHFCTVIAFTNAEEGPLLGKNLDFPLYAYQVLLTVEPDQGQAFTHVGCAGSVASYGGLNAAGLVMGHAAVPLKDARDSGGLPVAFVRRLAIQNCATTGQAISLVGQTDAWHMGDNLLFLDKGGEAAVIEIKPGMQRLRRPTDGVLWCTNCFAEFEPAEGNDKGQGRHAYLARIFGAEHPEHNRALLRNLLSGHEGEFPLCRDSTQLSFIANPTTGRLEIADGYPCQVGYRELF
jgi:predicted choloylglycine hydrolase